MDLRKVCYPTYTGVPSPRGHPHRACWTPKIQRSFLGTIAVPQAPRPFRGPWMGPRPGDAEEYCFLRKEPGPWRPGDCGAPGQHTATVCVTPRTRGLGTPPRLFILLSFLKTATYRSQRGRRPPGPGQRCAVPHARESRRGRDGPQATEVTRAACRPSALHAAPSPTPQTAPHSQNIHADWPGRPYGPHRAVAGPEALAGDRERAQAGREGRLGGGSARWRPISVPPTARQPQMVLEAVCDLLQPRGGALWSSSKRTGT